jgi:transcriptional regulator with XRE-family HTH domain
MTENLPALGRAVLKRREELGLTQAQVAERGGPSDTTLTGLESGTASSVSPMTLRKLDTGLQWGQGTARQILAEGRMPLGIHIPTVAAAPNEELVTHLIELSFAADDLEASYGSIDPSPENDDLASDVESLNIDIGEVASLAHRAAELAVGGKAELRRRKQEIRARNRAARLAGQRITQSDYVLAQRAGETEYEIRRKTEPQAEDENQDNGSDEPS